MGWLDVLGQLAPTVLNAFSSMGKAKESEQQGAMNQAYANRLQADAQQSALNSALTSGIANLNSLTTFDPLGYQARAEYYKALPQVKPASGSQANQYMPSIEGLPQMRAAMQGIYSPSNIQGYLGEIDKARGSLGTISQSALQQALNMPKVDTNPGPGALGYLSAGLGAIPGVLGALKPQGSPLSGMPGQPLGAMPSYAELLKQIEEDKKKQQRLTSTSVARTGASYGGQEPGS